MEYEQLEYADKLFHELLSVSVCLRYLSYVPTHVYDDRQETCIILYVTTTLESHRSSDREPDSSGLDVFHCAVLTQFPLLGIQAPN